MLQNIATIMFDARKKNRGFFPNAPIGWEKFFIAGEVSKIFVIAANKIIPMPEVIRAKGAVQIFFAMMSNKLHTPPAIKKIIPAVNREKILSRKNALPAKILPAKNPNKNCAALDKVP